MPVEPGLAADAGAGTAADARPDATPGLQAVMLLGPTASGKSAAAISLSRHFPIEIISVDSACVYRGLEIGTAKPSAEERASVAHHLIDCTDPWEPYSAARFAADATQLIRQIQARGRRPLLVGGTMLYARALMLGLDDLPVADPDIRSQIEQRANTLGWPALHAELALIDPTTAARLAPRDAQRIQRALEVARITGQPMSALLAQARMRPRSEAATPPWTVLSLEPGNRAVLHERIAARFEKMLADGLVAEVRSLRRDPRIVASLPAMRCVGYRQVWEALDTGLDEGELLQRGIAATRQLAKRQLTWLRGMPGRTVIDCSRDPNGQQVHDELAAILRQIWV